MKKIGLGSATILNVDYGNLRGRAEILWTESIFWLN